MLFTRNKGVAARGKLWIVSAWTGRYPTESNVQEMYVYDPESDSWDLSKTPLPENRRRGGAAAAVSLDEKFIYLSHGNRGGHETDDHAISLGWLDRYDIDNDTWTSLPDAPTPRDHT